MVERTAMAEPSESLNTQPSSFNRLRDIVAKLRAPGGCPWDQEQTHESLLPATIEEAYGKVARVNFDWKELRDVIAKVEEELGELKHAVESDDRESTEDEIGDLLFAVVNLARKCKLDAETALQSATDKFVGRFNLLENELRARGKKLGDADLAELDAIWNEIKRK